MSRGALAALPLAAFVSALLPASTFLPLHDATLAATFFGVVAAAGSVLTWERRRVR